MKIVKPLAQTVASLLRHGISYYRTCTESLKRHQPLSLMIFVRVLLLALTMVIGVSNIFAADIKWVSSVSGNVSDKNRWNLNRVPTTGDRLVITNSGTYTATVDINISSLNGIILGGASGRQTLVVYNNLLNVSSNCYVGVNGVITFNSGTMSGPNNLTVDGTMNWNGGAITKGIVIGPAGNLFIAASVTNRPPIITAPPQNATGWVGTNVSFTVATTGNTPMTYQWFFNGSTLGGQTNVALQLTNIQAAQAGNYSVVIKNSRGTNVSPGAVLTVIVPAVIVTEPVGRDVVAGSTVTFSVGTSGSAPISYQWYKDGVPLSGALNATLILTNVTLASSGNYSVVISNAAGGDTSLDAPLGVYQAPTITAQPQAQTGWVGTNVDFTVGVIGQVPFTYQWFLNGVALAGGTNVTLQLTNIQAAQAGPYSVLINNAWGSATSANAVLTVIVPAAIVTQPVGQEVLLGSTVLFSVSATGTAPLSYQWRKYGLPISGATNATLNLVNVTLGSSGSYSVTVTNVAGTNTSVNAYLGVHQAPTITAQPQSTTGWVGTNASFTVGVIGDNPFTYQWLFNGASMTNQTNMTLLLPNTQASQAGTYAVTIRNAWGTNTGAGAVLTVIVPPVISTQPLGKEVLLGSTVLFSASATGTAPLSYQWSKNGSPIFGATNSSLSLASVTLSSSGNYGVTVTNAAGTNTSVNAYLGVHQAPTITAQPQSTTGWVGTNASFTVGVIGDNPFTYQWLFNGASMANQTNVNLLLPNTQASQAGTYAVTIRNPWGTNTSAGAVLTVIVPPAITVQPVGKEVVVGSTVTFSVSATGTAPLSYQWYKRNAPMNGAINSSLTFTNLALNQTDDYSVVVRNAAGFDTSTLTHLGVHEPPTIVAQPRSATGWVGTNASFSVAVSGENPFTYQWYINGATMSGQTNVTLQLPNAQASQAGTYSVTVRNAWGSSSSAGAMLTIIVPPAITTQPVGKEVVVGTTLTFSVAATGTAPLSYQWRKNGLPISGATSANLTLTNVSLSSIGTYFVVITNAAGAATSMNAYLGVHEPPTITAQPQSITGWVGTNITLAVGVTGENPFTFQWYQNGATLAGKTNVTLPLPNLQASNAGTYTVIIKNGWGTNTSAGAVVTVIVPAAIVTQPIGKEVVIGSTVTFFTSATGTAPLSYQWLYNGTLVSGATRTNLSLTNVTLASIGNYSVVVTNTAGTNTSVNAYLGVHLPPTITAQPVSTTGFVGTNASFNVAVTGENPFTYQWLLNGASLSGQTNSLLLLTNAQSAQAGTYSVTVKNAWGTNTSTGAVLTIIVPATITQQPVALVRIPGATAFFSVKATGTAPLAYQWRKDGSQIPGATNTSLTLTNVDVPTSGDYSVVVTNRAGADTSMDAYLDVNGIVRQGWVARYNGTDNNDDYATAMKVDGQGNVYVTGYAENNNFDYVTIKYNSAGIQQWRAVYTSPYSGGYSFAAALALDTLGNVYVTGSSMGANGKPDYLTVKYNSVGTRLWTARFNGPANKRDTAAAIAVDTNGNVYVTGATEGNGAFILGLVGGLVGLDAPFHYGTVKYDSNGVQQWVAGYVGTGGDKDYAQALTLDAAGNIYVTGKSTGNGSGLDYATVKYNPAGTQIWAARYNGSGNKEDEACKVLVDAAQNVYVTGKSKGITTGYDYATIMYSASGVQQWVQRATEAVNQEDRAEDMVLDMLGNVIVTGSSRGTGANYDYLTLKYGPTGSVLWQARYNGVGLGDDFAHALTLDTRGNVYVTGSSESGSTGTDFATVKYSAENGNQIWVATYNGTESGDGDAGNDDSARAIAVDAANNVYVAGESGGSNSKKDYAVVQYNQHNPPVIVDQPLSQLANPGSTTLFTVTATGDQPMTFQWRLNGVSIPGATNSTFTLANVQPANSGTYVATIVNIADVVDSTPATLAVNAAAMSLQDAFTNRTMVVSLAGVGTGSSLGATKEVSEPKPGGKTGGKSVWFTWRAPASGVVTFTTAGSSFDTLLGVYTGNTLSKLTLVASDDDSGGFLTSLVKFNAQVGVDYQIQIDGLNGASGQIVVSWNLEVTTDRIPVVTSLSDGQTVGEGEQVTYAISVDQPGVLFQWFYNGALLPTAMSSSLNLTNIQPGDVGLYYVRLLAGTREILSKPIYLQINSTDEGVNRSSVALDKFEDMIAVSVEQFKAARAMRLGARGTTSRGYSSTQIFNTYSGSTQPGEPSNCGVPGGASSWYSYIPVADGTLYINTDGSSFDTTLGVYTGSGNDFATLVNVACDDNSGTNGRTSAVRFPAKAGTNYFISVDGKNGAAGHVVLHINLGDAPVIIAPPQSQIVAAGGSAMFSVDNTGSDPFAYEWRFNGVKITGATNYLLLITNIQPAKVGLYSAVVSNLINKVVSQAALLSLLSPTLNITAQPLGQTVSEGADVNFSIGANSSSAIAYQWRFNGVAISDATNSMLSLPSVAASAQGDYSVFLMDGGGSKLSAPATLTVSPNIVIVQNPASQTAAAGNNVTLGVLAYGSPKLDCQWKFNSANIVGATNSTLTITNLDAAKEGNYSVVVTNYASVATSIDATVMIGSTTRVVNPMRNADGSFQFQLIGLPNTNYLVSASTNLVDWQPLGQVSSPNGFIDLLDLDATNYPLRYYKATVQP